ncbi:MAG: acyl-CoA dehydrogenase, partial [Betaproteobacteria bacterium]|nr:acyl-CoA dehydrogenase [Betaproteobacteria bacterium]
MNSAAHLAWPFFDESHRSFKSQLQTWTRQQFADLHDHDESRDAIDRECVSLVKALGQGGWL